MTRRAPNIPNQDGRLTGELGKAVEAVHQSRRAEAGFFDGSGRFFAGLEWTSGEAKRIQHRLGRVPRGILASIPETAGAISGGLRLSTKTASSCIVVNNTGQAISCDLWVY